MKKALFVAQQGPAKLMHADGQVNRSLPIVAFDLEIATPYSASFLIYSNRPGQ